MLVGLPIKFRQGLSHHIELGLTVPLEYVGIALPQHQRDEVIGHSSQQEIAPLSSHPP